VFTESEKKKDKRSSYSNDESLSPNIGWIDWVFLFIFIFTQVNLIAYQILVTYSYKWNSILSFTNFMLLICFVFISGATITLLQNIIRSSFYQKVVF
jgi:hypothetical protein